MKFAEKPLRRVTSAAVCLALAQVLPLLTGQIPSVGNMLCPMHFPVLLCGLVCGSGYGALVGFAAPLLRFLLFGAPTVFPRGVVMALELATYGAASGALRRWLPKTLPYLYASLIGAMVAGRLVYGAAHTVIALLINSEFPLSVFFAGAVGEALPGIALQILILPPLTRAVEKAFHSSAPA